MGLFAFLRHDRKLADQVDSLEKRVAVLELEMHPARLVEWHSVQEQLRRYLARISAVEGRMKGKAESGEDPVTAAVLRMKYPSTGNGGS